MKIRFKTRDGLTAIKECPYIEEPVTIVMSPMWKKVTSPPTSEPLGLNEYRRYEFLGEVIDGIPTVVESYERPKI